jgi:hypothetical protein
MSEDTLIKKEYKLKGLKRVRKDNDVNQLLNFIMLNSMESFFETNHNDRIVKVESVTFKEDEDIYIFNVYYEKGITND